MMENKPEIIYKSCYGAVRENGFKGYDPYDLLNTDVWFLQKLPARMLFYLTQINKRSPLNLRPVLGIRKSLIPKGKALILRSVLKNPQLIEHPEQDIKTLVDSILEDKFEGYSGACWGLPFEYANRLARRNKDIGDVVATAYVHENLCQYAAYKDDKAIKDVLLSCSDFVLNDLQLTETPEGLKLNYDTQKETTVLNAIGFASDILVRNYILNSNDQEIKTAEKLLRFIVSYQEENGLFPYSEVGGKLNYQTDFHQLYVVSSLLNFKQATNSRIFDYAINKGLQFYLEHQVLPDGAICWRLPYKYPTDIHNQASAIYYLSKFSKVLAFDHSVIDRIYNFTVKEFYSEKGKYFYYQKYPLFTNRINYTRWGQAWMLYAISEYMQAERSPS